MRNPANGRKIPKKAVITELRSLNQTEQHLVFITKQHKLYITSLIFMLAGLRRGELICLEWSDIDFDNCEIIINKSVYENNNKFIIQHQAKTDLSIRRIKIPLFLLKLLKQSSQYTIADIFVPIHKEIYILLVHGDQHGRAIYPALMKSIGVF